MPAHIERNGFQTLDFAAVKLSYRTQTLIVEAVDVSDAILQLMQTLSILVQVFQIHLDVNAGLWPAFRC